MGTQNSSHAGRMTPSEGSGCLDCERSQFVNKVNSTCKPFHFSLSFLSVGSACDTCYSWKPVLYGRLRGRRVSYHATMSINEPQVVLRLDATQAATPQTVDRAWQNAAHADECT